MHASSTPRRLWLVLVLLVGLLGMHGLASDHASMAPSSGVTPATAGAHLTAHAGMHRAALVRTDQALGPRAAVGDDHGGMKMAGLCLAVLTGAVLTVASARGASLSGRRPGAHGSPWTPATKRRLAVVRPPDLVAGLCVSRT